MAYADGNIVIGTSVDMYGMNTGLYKIQRSIRKLQALMGVGVFAKFGKAAIDAASDLQEVQNIVDVSFEDMSYKIEDFSKTCIENFGMSELSAKQTAGSYTAMGKAIGFDVDKATDMSVTLTALTGDFASFYNISQDYARVALSAVYTGETETLKRYGIILTEANLQEYAASQGITEKVHAMSAQEKAQLRYNYILEHTKDIQGDFVRTQGTWANQTRVLQQVWNKFLIELGKGLTGVLTPLIGVLNSIIAALTRFIIVVRDALFFIFGIRTQTEETNNNSKEAAENINDEADAMDNLAGGTKAAAKEAKKSLAPFDELNRLMEPPSPSGGSGGGAVPELPELTIDDYAFKHGKDLIEELKEEIWSLYTLGEYISKQIFNKLVAIDWDKLYLKFSRFGTGLAQFLNGLVQPATFYAVGKTIANSLNTAILAAFNFNKTFEWDVLGQSIAASINSFFTNFDFATLAETLNDFVDGLYEALQNALFNIDKDKVIEGIKTFISNLDFDTIMFFVGLKLLKSARTIIPFMAKSLLSELPIILSVLKHKKMNIPFGFGGKPEPQGSIGGSVSGLLPKLLKIGAIIGGLVTTVTNFFTMLHDGFSWLNEALMLLGIALTTIGIVITTGIAAGPAAIIAAIVAAIATIVILIKDNWEAIKEWALETWEAVKEWFFNAIEWVKEKWTAFKEWIIGLWTTVKKWFFDLIDKIKQKWADLKAKVQEIWDTISTWFKTKVIDPIAEFFRNGLENIRTFFATTKQNVINVWQAVAGCFRSHVTEPLKNAFGGFFSFIKNGIVGAANAMISGVERAVNFIISGINTVIGGFNKVAVGAVKLFGGSWQGIPYVNPITLPRVPALANGAVIPPNSPFMAQLGDQKSGMNLEAPEKLIRQIVREESGSPILEKILQAILDSSEKSVILDGEEVGKFVTDYQSNLARSGG